MSDNEQLSTTVAGEEEDLEKYKGNRGCVSRWLKEIDLVKNSKVQKKFESDGEKIIKIYKNSTGAQSATSQTVARTMFNVLWSNVQVLRSAYYARMPNVVVERRFKDMDPVGRLASDICERATSFILSIQQDRFNYSVGSAVQDRLLPGRGQVWLRYDADFEETNSEEETEPTEPAESTQQLKVNSEMVFVDPVNWLDYFHNIARNPYEIRWRARRVFMTRSELVDRFGAIGKKVELNFRPGGTRAKMSDDERQFLMQAEIYEIWDKTTKNVYWISEGYEDGPLDVRKDPLKLKDFFPCPVELLATVTSDSTYPTPDYKIYERLADELDYVTKRISSMIDCIRFVGATAAQFNKDIKSMLSLKDGQIWPIENWARWAESGGFKGAIDWMPFEQCVAALAPLQAHQQSLLDQIFEITGIPDIVRGSTDPSETMGAQQQKSHWTMVKIAKNQADVQRFCREIISKVGEIIFETGLFSDETIALMCGVAQMPPDDQQNFLPALQLLRDDRLRTFRVDIETDSTIAIDEEQERGARMEYIAAVNSLIANVQNISQFRPELMHPVIESALFAIRSFRTGRPLEAAWTSAMQQIEDNDAQAAQNPQQPPDYESQKLQLMAQDLQAKQLDMQFKEQMDQQKFQLDMQKAQQDYEIKVQQLQIDGSKVMSQQQLNAMDQELEKFKENFNQFVQTQMLDLQKYKVVLDEREKMLEEARLAKDQQMAEIERTTGQTKSPTIHIHNSGGSKEIALKRMPDGALVGHARDMPDLNEQIKSVTKSDF